jgi:pSer/pThr/pTyr-binding forkhead associated (FHA) protein
VLIEHFPAVVGRGSDADVRFRDAWISRVHCLLTLDDGRLSVRDLHSRHGTFVNGEPTIERALEPGDVLGLGLSAFRVEYDCRPAEWPARSGHASEAGAELRGPRQSIS